MVLAVIYRDWLGQFRNLLPVGGWARRTGPGRCQGMVVRSG